MCGGATKCDSLPVGTDSRQNWRRRSADVGGLHLAMGNDGHGQGWVGGSGELGTGYAELLTDLYTATLHTVQEHGLDFAHIQLPPDSRKRLIYVLERWHFEPHQLSELELLHGTFILFEGLYCIEGMEEAVGISMAQITKFIQHLRRMYRLENSYHNFVHALDVLQALYSYLRTAAMIPPLSILLEPGRMWKPIRTFNDDHLITCLGPLELFVLYIAAIGHDAGHPGFTNTFMKNAVAPLSTVYGGKSALEQMHCQFLIHTMKQHGLRVVLERPGTGVDTRKLLSESILVTDMIVHDNFMKRFHAAIDGYPESIQDRQILICQALMKCADISNPSRPWSVSKKWAGALMEEWSSQALYEKYLELPLTVQSTDSPINEAKTQVFFIDKFAKPLLDLVVMAVPEMNDYAGQCTTNLRVWRKRLRVLEAARDSQFNNPSTIPRHPDDYMNAFPLTLPPVHRLSQTSDTVSGSPTAIDSRSSESTSNTSESNLASPSGSVSSFAFSPISDSSASHTRPLSSIGGANTPGSLPPSLSPPLDEHATIRAAGKLGIRRQKSMNRNSWSPSAFVNQPPVPAVATLLVSTTDPTSSPTILPPDLGITNTIVINPIKTKLQKAQGI